MAGEGDEPDEAATRLETALERIAVAAERRINVPAPVATQPAESAAVASAGAIESQTTMELAARLDGLIERLRGALAVRPG
jgi:hypothetical protein